MSSQTAASAVKKAARKPVVRAAPVKPEPKKEKPWTMPMPSRGQVVLYYHRGTKSARNTDIAFVASVSEKQIAVSFRNQGYDDVYHVDDPRLKSNPDLVNDIHGLWDFTQEQIELDNRLSEIEKRLDALES